MSHSVLSTFVVCAVMVSACGGSQQTPAASAATQGAATTADNPKPDDDATKGNINVAEDVKKACGLSDDEAYFAFNSAAVTDKDKAVLRNWRIASRRDLSRGERWI